MLNHTQLRLCKLRAQGLTLKEISAITRFTYGTTRTYFSEIYKIIGRPQVDMSMISTASKSNEIN